MNRIALLLFLLLFSTLATASRVVFIHSYHFSYPWVQQYRTGFLNEIGKIQLDEYELDTKRKPDVEFSAISNSAWHFIEQKKPDLVVLADDNALRLLGRKITENNIPLVFLGINSNPRDYLELNAYTSGAIERPLMNRSVSMLIKLLPELKHVNVMMDNRATSHAILETSFNNKVEQSILGITVSSSLISDYKTWKERVLNAKELHYDALIIANYAALSDESGDNVPLDEVSEWTSNNSPVPVFSFWSYSIGKGKTIGGLTISGEQQGEEAAKLVNDYFSSGALRPIVTPARGRFIFSEYELKRWGIVLPQFMLDKALLLP
ncbi:hypothetical protein L4D20_02935 [Vibrio kyushuensis]|uniref:ABC transporter substrate-binding protein n=1 Tax=Vibrio kyushuensis TaxID=2910249 RepID=UPI003D1128BD